MKRSNKVFLKVGKRWIAFKREDAFRINLWRIIRYFGYHSKGRINRQYSYYKKMTRKFIFIRLKMKLRRRALKLKFKNIINNYNFKKSNDLNKNFNFEKLKWNFFFSYFQKRLKEVVFLEKPSIIKLFDAKSKLFFKFKKESKKKKFKRILRMLNFIQRIKRLKRLKILRKYYRINNEEKKKDKIKKIILRLVLKHTNNNFFFILTSLKGKTLWYCTSGQLSEGRTTKKKRSHYVVDDILIKFWYLFAYLKPQIKYIKVILKSDITKHMRKVFIYLRKKSLE